MVNCLQRQLFFLKDSPFSKTKIKKESLHNFENVGKVTQSKCQYRFFVITPFCLTAHESSQEEDSLTDSN